MGMARRALLTLTALATAVTLASFVTPSAHAEVSDAIDRSIVEAALENLGTEPLSDALTNEIIQGVDAASDAGIIDPTLIDIIDEPTAGDGTEGAMPVEELLDENLQETQEQWDEVAPIWRAAFEEIRTDFAACRTDGASTASCARALGFRLQAAQATALLADLDARAAAAADLPESEQVAALALIEEERAVLEARLARAQEKLATSPAVSDARDAEHLAAALSAVRGRSATHSSVTGPAASEGNEITTSPQASPQPRSQPTQGATTAPTAPSQSQTPRASEPTSQPGKTAGKPENPGKSGQSNGR